MANCSLSRLKGFVTIQAQFSCTGFLGAVFVKTLPVAHVLRIGNVEAIFLVHVGQGSFKVFTDFTIHEALFRVNLLAELLLIDFIGVLRLCCILIGVILQGIRTGVGACITGACCFALCATFAHLHVIAFLHLTVLLTLAFCRDELQFVEHLLRNGRQLSHLALQVVPVPFRLVVRMELLAGREHHARCREALQARHCAFARLHLALSLLQTALPPPPISRWLWNWNPLVLNEEDSKEEE
mmetsp:Transcript_6941/g.11303  ORF Transcript_6941/g.11303 Transcript_6941/m.11303 type:complete len:240 (-) Transcript_6941:118-837(-)